MRRSCSSLTTTSTPFGTATPAWFPSKRGRGPTTTSRFPKRTISPSPSGLPCTTAATTTRLSCRPARQPLPSAASWLSSTAPWLRGASRRVHSRTRGAIQQSAPSASRLLPATRARAYRTKLGISCSQARCAIISTSHPIRCCVSVGNGVC